jgi:hypothetical protein
MHAGLDFVQAGMLSSRLRRRFTSATAWSSPTSVQLFCPDEAQEP